MAGAKQKNHHVFTPDEDEQFRKFWASFIRWGEPLGISFAAMQKDKRLYHRTLEQFWATPEGISTMKESPIMAGEEFHVLNEHPTALQHEILKRALHEAHAAGLSDEDAGRRAGECLKERMPGKGIIDIVAIQVYAPASDPYPANHISAVNRAQCWQLCLMLLVVQTQSNEFERVWRRQG
jgi:hypothetical protein